MYITKNFGIRGILAFSGHHMLWILAWSSAVTAIYAFTDYKWIFIPWQPVAIVGTAVAFYVGFKNNQSYDRLWEARKIWGAIVNSSRSWGAASRAFVTNNLREEKISPKELYEIHKDLIYRHIAWLYVLRQQLLIPTSWEHVNQGRIIGRYAKKLSKRSGVGLIDEETRDIVLELLSEGEIDNITEYKNIATQLIDHQSQRLKDLNSRKLVDDYRHVQLQKILDDFYEHQGKCERIKKFPLPRQYANMSFIFVGIFIFLLPFATTSIFGTLGIESLWISIPVTSCVAWLYLVMELVGDYSENPFEGLGNDIPMMSLCRTIEIDLREMLGETDLPPGIEPKNGVLM